MPRIPDVYLHCVFYLYLSETDANAGEPVGGTGFLVGVPSESNWHVYAVTNAHCLPKFNEVGSRFARLNLNAGGTDIIELPNEKWERHPNRDDIAVCLVNISNAIYKYAVIPENQFITHQVIDKEDIGPGDDVFMVGRFINHEGKQRNTPSLRFGNIAMMPIEPIHHPHGHDQESFMIETRSLGGFSGSPVFVHLSPFRNGNIHMEPKDPWLLGIDWGHLPIWEPLRERDQETLDYEGKGVNSNSGAAGVVPAWKLSELLHTDKLEEERQMLDEEKTKTGSKMVLDSVEPSPFQKFQEGLRLGLSAPKEDVKKSMEEESQRRQKLE